MKFTSAIVLVASLLAPANVEAETVNSNPKRCVNTDPTVDRNGATQVRVGCIGNAADFGVQGDLDNDGLQTDKVDCFAQPFYHDGRQCDPFQVTIQYKVQNAMNDGLMSLKFANFKFGGLSVYPEDPSDKPTTIFQPNTAVLYKYQATVYPCDENRLTHTAWMQMKLAPEEGEDFYTNICGTQDFIEFRPFETGADVFGPGAGADVFGPGAGADVFGPGAGADVFGPGAGDDAKAPKASKAPSAPKASKAPHTSKSPTVGKGSKSPTVGKGDGSGEEGQRRNNRVRRATSRRTPVRA